MAFPCWAYSGSSKRWGRTKGDTQGRATGQWEQWQHLSLGSLEWSWSLVKGEVTLPLSPSSTRLMGYFSCHYESMPNGNLLQERGLFRFTVSEGFSVHHGGRDMPEGSALCVCLCMFTWQLDHEAENIGTRAGFELREANFCQPVFLKTPQLSKYHHKLGTKHLRYEPVEGGHFRVKP